jgi:O-antigen/teichoic acid export membrane protein
MVDNDLNIDLPTVKNRAVKGVFALSGRMVIIQAVSSVGFFLLSILLDIPEIGLFFAISGIVDVLGYFSDVGLAAALIQKKEIPETKDIRSTFTIQQALVLALITLVFILTPWLKNFYQISDSGIYLLWSLVLGFFLSSLKTIPSVLLERKLRFELLAIVEIIETFVFYGLAVFLAWKGFGIMSYAVAVIVRGFAGVIMINILSPWPIGFAFETTSLKHLLKFGIPYQANSFLAVVKDRLMNFVLWKIIGADGVGIMGWAQKWAQTPLRLIMDSVMKVTFPAYSRMQDDKEELKKAIEKTLFFVTLLVMPMFAGIVLLAKPLILLIPKYGKWEVALLALYLLVINSFFASITTPLTNALSAIGKIKTVFKLMVMWTVLTWIFYPILAIKFGFNGVALASALVGASSLVAIWIVKKSIDFRLWPSINMPILASISMSLIILLLRPFLSTNILGLIFLIIFSAIIYFGVIVITVGPSFLIDVRKIFSTVRNKI